MTGNYTLGSSVSFYTQQPVSLVDGRINGLWFGSYWPDAPHVFETNDSLHTLWSQKDRRVFLFTLDPARRADLVHYGPVYGLQHSAGKVFSAIARKIARAWNESQRASGSRPCSTSTGGRRCSVACSYALSPAEQVAVLPQPGGELEPERQAAGIEAACTTIAGTPIMLTHAVSLWGPSLR